MALDETAHDAGPDDSSLHRLLAVGLAGLLVGTFLELLWQARYVVPLQTDDLIYHLSIPATWLQNGWLTPFTPWFHEPAPGYGPVLVELLTTALMAMTGGEFWARLVLLPFQIGIAALTWAILRRLRVPASPALIVAAGTFVLRPFMLQTLSFHNDVGLTCAFLLAVWGWLGRPIRLHPNNATFAFVAGVALLLSIKYVAVIYVLVLVLGAVLWNFRHRPERDKGRPRPVGPRWTRAAAAWAGLSAMLLLGGWTFIRTWWITGNPVYPAEIAVGEMTLFDGLYSSAQVADYSISWRAIADLLVSRTEEYTLPTLTGMAALACTLTVSLAWPRRNNPAATAQWAIVGLLPIGCVLVFVTSIPFGEPRLLSPVYALIWMAPATCAARWDAASPTRRSAGLGLVLVALFVLGAAWEGPARSLIWRPLPIAAGVAAAAAAHLARRYRRAWHGRAGVYGLVALALTIVGLLYVYDPALRTAYARARSFAGRYGDLGAAWDWLNDATEDSPAAIAFTGTAMRYPLYGRNLQNRVLYVHVAPGNHQRFHEYVVSSDDRPRASAIELATALFRRRFDEDHWLHQIDMENVDYLLVARPEARATMPIEYDWAFHRPDRFEIAVDFGDAAVFRVLRPDGHGGPIRGPESRD